MFSSCVDSKYDLDDIDDSGGLSPSLVLPIGTLKTGIIDFLEGAGIPEDLLQIGQDTIYVVYSGKMQLNSPSEIPAFGNSDYISYIPPGLTFEFDGGSESIDIDIFKDLASSGSVLRPSRPRISCTVRNYIGADITVEINSIKSFGSQQEREAVFSNGENSYSISLGSAPERGEHSSRNVTFDRTNGQMDKLFSNSPERISYDFSVDLTVPEGGGHFMVKDKYVDVDYEVRIPLTFSPGTQLIYADTLDFDLSGDSFINNIDNLTIWIEYENSLRTTVDLDVLFLDENREVIPGITQKFQMKAAPAARETRESPMPYSFAKEELSFSFNSSQFNDARKARYAALKSTLKTDSSNSEVNIHPSDHINLKLSAYSKVNI
jgi:hypothetical protein